MSTIKVIGRRLFLRRATSAAALLAGWGIGQAQTDRAATPDAEVLARAAENIQKHRRGPGVVVVHGKDGKVLPGVEVGLEQVRHDFLFGCNFFMFGRLQEAEHEEAYRQRFAALLNYATLGFYWPYYEPQRGRPIYDYTDQVVKWCQEHAITCKGHPLVWDYADPRWLPQDFAEIRELSHARVREIVARYKGRIDIWDVVNEPTHLGRFKTRTGEWAISVGAVPYVIEHLKIARAAHPRATLLVNDYRTDPPFLRILEALREEGKLLFDVVGIQSHMHGGGWPPGRVWEVCDTYARLGLPVHFTETTIVSGPRIEGEPWKPTTPEGEAAQAEYVPKFYTTLFGHPAVKGLTWWDFSDQGAWQGAPAGLVRRDMSPKPVYERLEGLIRRDWWSRGQAPTNAQGEAAFTAFYGTHRISARLPTGETLTKEVHWAPGNANRFELTLT